MEIGHDQAAKLELEYSESAEWAFQGVRKDLGGIARVVIFQRKS